MTLFTLLLVLAWERLFKLGNTGSWIIASKWYFSGCIGFRWRRRWR